MAFRGGMFVIKRDGRRQEVHFDKITARIMKLSYNLNPEFCDPVSARHCWSAPVQRVHVQTFNLSLSGASLLGWGVGGGKGERVVVAESKNWTLLPARTGGMSTSFVH